MDAAVTIRPFAETDADFHAVAALWSTIFPDFSVSANEMRNRDRRADPDKYFLQRVMAVDAAGVIGCGTVLHMPWAYDPNRYELWVGVQPERQRQGIGSALYEHLLGVLRARGAAEAWSNTRETLADAVGFLTRRGFEEKSRLWESRLHVPEFDPAPYQPLLERITREGIVIETLADLQQRDPNWLEVLYELDVALSADIPMPVPFTSPTIDEYRIHQVEDPGFTPAGFFLARDGGRFVGLSNIERRETRRDSLAHGFTGVRREYRGRGIATALKVRTIEYARQHGYVEIVTDNSTLNAPMLAINERLGFVRQPAWLEMVKYL